MANRWGCRALLAGSCLWLAGASPAPAGAPEPGRLFYRSASRGLTADCSAGGTLELNFATEASVIPDGAERPGLQFRR